MSESEDRIEIQTSVLGKLVAEMERTPLSPEDFKALGEEFGEWVGNHSTYDFAVGARKGLAKVTKRWRAQL